MKNNFLFFLFLFVLLGASAVSVSAQCDTSKLSQVQCGYYNEGYQDGIKDAQNKLSNYYQRYKEKYDRRNEVYYNQGYQAGYNTITPFQKWTQIQRDIYDRGYRNGIEDKRKGISRLPQRYEGKYDKSYVAFYERGYYNGYDGANRQYDIPLETASTPPIIPNQPTPTNFPVPTPTPTANTPANSGSASWTGKVDDRVSISLQGSELRNVDLSGTGLSKVSFRLNGSLPLNRTSEVTVRKVEGRGNVSVIQQPGRANDYRAIIQIEDNQKGSDTYRIDISWVSLNIEEPYQSGMLYWGGRVDQSAQIRITGKDIQTIDLAQTGVFNVSHNLNGYLARRVGNINVRKLKGRGSVFIVQQPNWENEFTAIVQISDPEKGASDYQIEITW